MMCISTVAHAQDAGPTTSLDAGIVTDAALPAVQAMTPDSGVDTVDASSSERVLPPLTPSVDAGLQTEPEVEADAGAAPPLAEAIPAAQVDVQEATPDPIAQVETTLDELLEGVPWGRWTVWRLLFWLLAAVLLAYVAGRLRERLPTSGAIPRIIRTTHIGLQIGGVLIAGALLARLLSPSLGPALPWMILVASAAVAWSARDIMPDLVASIVLALEQRIRTGMWVSGEGYAGIVERRGLRAVWLRDGHGNRIAVPNRRFLDTPVVSQLTAGPFHEVSVRLATKEPARMIRQALNDAVLTSPWVHPDVACVVRRDGRDPRAVARASATARHPLRAFLRWRPGRARRRHPGRCQEAATRVQRERQGLDSAERIAVRRLCRQIVFLHPVDQCLPTDLQITRRLGDVVVVLSQRLAEYGSFEPLE